MVLSYVGVGGMRVVMLVLCAVMPLVSWADVSYTVQRATYGGVPYSSEVAACDAAHGLLVGAYPVYGTAGYTHGVFASRCLELASFGDVGSPGAGAAWELLGVITAAGTAGGAGAAGSGGVVSMAPFDLSAMDGVSVAYAVSGIWFVAFGFRQVFRLLKRDDEYEQD